ncbi:hypothetical protein P692DRAFT_20317162 [Suillus brevipes Sb2]|nr:hypothetical protein P692DRAFT_20317162 [Suillus brevipes Sb2]
MESIAQAVTDIAFFTISVSVAIFSFYHNAHSRVTQQRLSQNEVVGTLSGK